MFNVNSIGLNGFLASTARYVRTIKEDVMFAILLAELISIRETALPVCTESYWRMKGSATE